MLVELHNEGMRTITPDQVAAALDELSSSLRSYIWLQQHVRSCNVGVDINFQTRFDAFYRVRRNAQWRAQYFALMESAKQTGIDFPDALREMNLRTGRIEASFASKLVATLSPSTPIIDAFVLKNFGLKLPAWGSPAREFRTIETYSCLCSAYERLLSSATGTLIRHLFDQRFPTAGITDLKKADLVLWQIRE